MAERVAGCRSRKRDHSRSLDAQLGTRGIPALLSRSHQTPRISARHLHDAARICARHAIDLQRPRIHAARFILEDAASASAGVPASPDQFDPTASLSAQFQRVATFVTDKPLTFNPPRAWRPRVAPTEIDPWRGRLLTGEVHDENTWALGGAAGHSGLFGTAAAVGAFARAVLRTMAGEAIVASADTMRLFARRAGIPQSSRALAWDTMLPTSSCGSRLSPTAIGHTGFTGTSLWIDWERDFYVVLLSNRVHPTRENLKIRQFRPRFHDAVVAALSQ